MELCWSFFDFLHVGEMYAIIVLKAWGTLIFGMRLVELTETYRVDQPMLTAMNSVWKSSNIKSNDWAKRIENAG